jgi:predicted enzyme related to lactoylglutathione lyase
MPTRFTHLAYDAADIALLARFWSDLLGWPVTFEAGDEVYVEAPEEDGSAMGIAFVPVPEPKTTKNRVHWDVKGSVPALLETGARMIRPATDDPEPDRDWDVLADPEGNEFCVFAP